MLSLPFSLSGELTDRLAHLSRRPLSSFLCLSLLCACWQHASLLQSHSDYPEPGPRSRMSLAKPTGPADKLCSKLMTMDLSRLPALPGSFVYLINSFLILPGRDLWLSSLSLRPDHQGSPPPPQGLVDFTEKMKARERELQWAYPPEL